MARVLARRRWCRALLGMRERERRVTSKGELELESDGGDAEVSCSVTASGSGFAVSGTVRYEGRYLAVSIAELKKDATLAAPSTGHVELATAQTGGTYRSDQCSFFFADEQLVDEGKVWATFQCPTVVGPDDSTCAVTQGYFALELCD